MKYLLAIFLGACCAVGIEYLSDLPKALTPPTVSKSRPLPAPQHTLPYKGSVSTAEE